MIVSLVYDETGNTAILRFTYDRGLVERLKTIPHEYRSFNAETKAWRVQRPYDRIAADALLRSFPGAQVEDGPYSGRDFGDWALTQPQPPLSSCTADHKLLGVCPAAGPDLVKAALRIAAKKNHPDVGGSTNQMQAINAAADRLLEAVSR